MTWNVNSVKQRLPRLLPWLDQRQPDFLCLPETSSLTRRSARCSTTSSPRAATRWRCTARRRWNGVAILSRVGLDDVVRGIPGGPGFPEPEARAVSATCGGLRIVSRLRPQRPPARLRSLPLQARVARRAARAGRPGRRACCRARRHEHRAGRRRRLRPWRLRRSDPRHRARAQGARRAAGASACTTWSATAGRTSASSATGTTAPACSTRTSGCASTWCSRARPVAARVRAAWVDRHARKGKGPSDHAPVIVDLDEAPDGDIGPVVPAPVGAGHQTRRQKAFPQA